MVEKDDFATPISKIDDFVKHVFGEHNREADLLANMETEGQLKNVTDRSSFSESWQAMKGFWHGSSKDNSESGCGKVIKRVGWVTISKIAIPLKVGTATAAEVAVVRVLTGILDVVFNK